MNFKEALQALADGKRVRRRLDDLWTEFEFNHSVLWGRSGTGTPWSLGWVLFDELGMEWTIVPRETILTGLTIQQCAALDADGNSYLCRRPGSTKHELRQWDYPRNQARCAWTIDLAATDWEAKVVEGE